MELMEDLDPEEARAIVDPALNLDYRRTRAHSLSVGQSRVKGAIERCRTAALGPGGHMELFNSCEKGRGPR
jgi:hypothetical protein